MKNRKSYSLHFGANDCIYPRIMDLLITLQQGWNFIHGKSRGSSPFFPWMPFKIGHSPRQQSPVAALRCPPPSPLQCFLNNVKYKLKNKGIFTFFKIVLRVAVYLDYDSSTFRTQRPSGPNQFHNDLVLIPAIRSGTGRGVAVGLG